jgi:hypothetical protein
MEDNTRMRHNHNAGEAHHAHAVKGHTNNAYDENENNNGYSLDEPQSGSSGKNSLEIEMQPLQLADAEDDDSLDDFEERVMYPIKVEALREKGWRQALDDWLFPPEVPRCCQILRPENLAIPACYLLVGLLQGLSSPLVNVFPLDLNATQAQQTTLSSIRSLPASFKLIFGFLSDNVPIFGYRRKPYMLFGWLLASLSLFMLLLLSNLHVTPGNAGCFESADSAEETVPPDDAPSIAFLSLSLLGFGTGFWLADVMGDSIVAERAKLEPAESRGSIQSFCYSCRFFGLMVAAPLSTYLYSTVGPYFIILLLSVMPLTILPLIWGLDEVKDAPISSTKDQCHEIWKTVCSRAVWQPMGFVYLYNLLQVGNSAWREYLTVVLHFTTCQLNLILITAFVLLYLGVLSYKYWFITWSWRKVYIVTTVLGAIFSFLQVLLIRGITFGLSNFWFALGDDAFAEFIQGIQFLVSALAPLLLCLSVRSYVSEFKRPFNRRPN